MHLIDRHAILATLESLLGVPFRHGGRDRRGLDCLGVLMYVAQEHGIALEDQRGYAASTDGSELTRQCQRQLVEIPLPDAAPADVVQWAEWSSPKAPPCNLAFLGWRHGRVTMVHAMVKFGMVTETHFSRPWPQAVRHVYRLPGVAPWLPVVEA